MLLMNSNYKNNKTLNFQNLNYSKVNTCFSWSGKTADSDQWNDKKNNNNAITPVKMSRKGHKRFPEKSDYLKKKNSQGNHSSIHLSRLNHSLL